VYLHVLCLIRHQFVLIKRRRMCYTNLIFSLSLSLSLIGDRDMGETGERESESLSGKCKWKSGSTVGLDWISTGRWETHLTSDMGREERERFDFCSCFSPFDFVLSGRQWRELRTHAWWNKILGNDSRVYEIFGAGAWIRANILITKRNGGGGVLLSYSYRLTALDLEFDWSMGRIE
jgi:hypothetical protein